MSQTTNILDMSNRISDLEKKNSDDVSIAELNAKALEVSQGAEQLIRDTVGWTGKNLLPYPYYETTKIVNGITFTDNGDGSITCTGKATSAASFVLKHQTNINKILVPGKYILNGCPQGGGNNSFSLRYFMKTENYSNVMSAIDNGNGANINFLNNQQSNYYSDHILIRFEENYDIGEGNSITFYPMLRLASVLDDTYEQYHANVEDYIDLRVEQLIASKIGLLFNGGTTGQVLTKHSDTDLDMEWAAIPTPTQEVSPDVTPDETRSVKKSTKTTTKKEEK